MNLLPQLFSLPAVLLVSDAVRSVDTLHQLNVDNVSLLQGSVAKNSIISKCYGVCCLFLYCTLVCMCVFVCVCVCVFVCMRVTNSSSNWSSTTFSGLSERSCWMIEVVACSSSLLCWAVENTGACWVILPSHSLCWFNRTPGYLLTAPRSRWVQDWCELDLVESWSSSKDTEKTQRVWANWWCRQHTQQLYRVALLAGIKLPGKEGIWGDQWLIRFGCWRCVWKVLSMSWEQLIVYAVLAP